MLVYNLITIFIIIVEVYTKEVHNNNDENSFGNRVTKYLEKKCKKNATLDDLEKAIKNYEKASVCFKKKFPKHTSEDEYKLKEKCIEAVEEITECIKMMLNSIKPCLNEDEQYLPSFIAEAYEGYAEAFCEHSDMLTFPNILYNGIAQCVNRFRKYKDTSPQHVCYGFAKFSNHTDHTSITKKEICSDMESLYNCYERHYKKHCKDSPKAWEFESELLKGMQKPCREKKS